jgi:hypothetical protein
MKEKTDISLLRLGCNLAFGLGRHRINSLEALLGGLD